MTKPEDYAQRSLKVGVIQGDYITKAKLNEKGMIGKSAQIPLGSRIFTINVDETQSASNMLNPGDKVDVLVTFDARTPSGMQTRSLTVLERVDVFAVQDKTKGDRLSSGDSGKVNARQVSLVVTPEETTLLALAQRKGQLGLVWRNPLDKTVNTSKAATEQLLADLRGTDNENRPEVGGEAPQPEVKPAPAPVQETKPAVPDLASFLDQARKVVVETPRPAPASVVETRPATPTWEVKVYKGNQIQSYPFEVSEGAANDEAQQKAEKRVEPPAKSASSAVDLLQSFGISLPNVGFEKAPAKSPAAL